MQQIGTWTGHAIAGNHNVKRSIVNVLTRGYHVHSNVSVLNVVTNSNMMIVINLTVNRIR